MVPRQKTELQTHPAIILEFMVLGVWALLGEGGHDKGFGQGLPLGN